MAPLNLNNSALIKKKEVIVENVEKERRNSRCIARYFSSTHCCDIYSFIITYSVIFILSLFQTY